VDIDLSESDVVFVIHCDGWGDSSRLMPLLEAYARGIGRSW